MFIPTVAALPQHLQGLILQQMANEADRDRILRGNGRNATQRKMNRTRATPRFIESRTSSSSKVPRPRSVTNNDYQKRHVI